MKHLRLLVALLLLVSFAAFGDSTWSVPGRPSEIATAQVALSTTAASVIAGNKLRRSVTIRNHDAAISIYVGATGVTSSTGILVKAGESITLFTTGPVYAVAASGTPTAGYIAEND